MGEIGELRELRELREIIHNDQQALFVG